MVRIESCAGIAANRLLILTLLAVLCDARAAERICAHAETAASIHQAQKAAARRQTQNRRQKKNAAISATGFHLTQSTAQKPKAKQMKRKKQMLQERLLMIYSNNFLLINHG